MDAQASTDNATPAAAAGTPAPAAEKPPEAQAQPATEQKTEPQPKPIDLGKGFAALAREEQRIRGERQALKAEQQAIAQHRAVLDAIAKAKENPLAALQATGLTYEQLTEWILQNQQEPTEADRLAALEKREQERQERAKADEEKAKQDVAAKQIETFKGNLTKAITDAGEKYELINAEGAHEAVWEVIEGNFEKTGQVMAWADAADLVEKHLEERAKKLLAAKKLQPKTEQKQDAPAAPAKSESQKTGPESDQGSTERTLTNRSTTGSSSERPAPLPLDPDERTRAIVARRRAASARA